MSNEFVKTVPPGGETWPMSGKTSCGYNKHLNTYSGIFISTVLDMQRPRYSFGVSWTGERLLSTILKLPADEDDNPDWKYMEDYIKSLPYGDLI